MIRTEQEEFFIEPVETGHHVIEHEDGGGGRPHIVYRSAAVKKPPFSLLAADTHSKGQLCPVLGIYFRILSLEAHKFDLQMRQFCYILFLCRIFLTVQKYVV